MKSRELAALLKVLRQFGVTSYRAGDVSVQFATGEPIVAAPAEETGDLELPSGVIDPRKALQDIYAKRGKRAA